MNGEMSIESALLNDGIEFAMASREAIINSAMTCESLTQAIEAVDGDSKLAKMKEGAIAFGKKVAEVSKKILKFIIDSMKNLVSYIGNRVKGKVMDITLFNACKDVTKEEFTAFIKDNANGDMAMDFKFNEYFLNKGYKNIERYVEAVSAGGKLCCDFVKQSAKSFNLFSKPETRSKAEDEALKTMEGILAQIEIIVKDLKVHAEVAELNRDKIDMKFKIDGGTFAKVSMFGDPDLSNIYSKELSLKDAIVQNVLNMTFDLGSSKKGFNSDYKMLAMLSYTANVWSNNFNLTDVDWLAKLGSGGDPEYIREYTNIYNAIIKGAQFEASYLQTLSFELLKFITFRVKATAAICHAIKQKKSGKTSSNESTSPINEVFDFCN